MTMMMKFLLRSFLILPVLLVALELSAQEPVKPESINAGQLEEKIEQLGGQADADIDFSEMVDELLQYISNPINLNSASERELRQLQLNDLQINNLTAYVQKYGQLTSIYELGMIEGFDSTLAIAISPFITFELQPEGAKINLKNLSKYGRHQIITR